MANIKIQPEKRYLYTEKKSAGNMKTTSIYTLFFSPTGTSRKIAAAVAQGMTETEGTATEESAGHNADAAQAPSSGQVPGAGPAAAAAPEPAAGNGGETKSMHGEPTVTAIDLTHPAGHPAPLPGETVAIFAVPVYGGHVEPWNACGRSAAKAPRPSFWPSTATARSARPSQNSPRSSRDGDSCP